MGIYRSSANPTAGTRRAPTPLGLFFFLGLLLPHPTLAQEVRGVVLGSETGEPRSGALVLLLTGRESDVAAGYLSDEDGRYSLEPPGPGEYRVRVELLGFRTREEGVRLEGEEILTLNLPLQASPLSLEGIRVEGSARCLVRPEEGLEVAGVWEEARKVLENQRQTSKGGYLRFDLLRYRREMDLSLNLVQKEERLETTVVGETPIRSLPAEDLSSEGYVRMEEDGAYHYYGPDAQVLLSDPFLDSHCFRLVEDQDQPKLIGLSFEPVGRGNLPDIEGTFWISRETAQLRLLTYRYTWAPWQRARGVASGRIEFEGTPTGAWIIRKWWIRMPIIVLDFGIRTRGGEGYRLEGIMEEGGEAKKVLVLERGWIVDSARMGQTVS